LPAETTSVLLVEGDADLRLALGSRLAEAGYRVETAGDGEDALARALSDSFDVVLLDASLPEKGGLDACRDLRRGGFDGPIILITGGADVADRILGLKLGADDCLETPFDLSELVARLEACLRRACAPTGCVCRFGGIEVDLRGARVLRDGHEVAMTPRELQLLRCLIEHEGTPLSRDEILDRAWGHDAMPTPRTVDVHVAWLRRKLEADPHRPTLIRTVHGVGYRFTGVTGEKA